MAEAKSYPRYTVSSLTEKIRAALEKPFAKIIVDGEISGWRRYPSGHCYFTLKDADAQISAVLFKGTYERLAEQRPDVVDGLKDGAKVTVYGNVSVYGPRGNYQFTVLSAKLAGVGDLMQRYLALKAKLEGEGLFDAARKRPLPKMPRRIGLVTSEAGAVVHDMCTVLTRRFPNLEIRLYPCLVQGETAAATVCAGLAYFNAATDWRADLLIVARGGGSFEDLFCFNDEALVRAVAASEIPTISAVGHETDFTLCDFAADVRAGTPSIAAEIAVPVLADLRAQLAAFDERLAVALRGRGEFFAQRLDQLSDGLGAALSLALARAERRLDALGPRLRPALTLRLQQATARFEKAEAKLVAYSPYGVLERGYSLTTTADGAVVRDADALHAGDSLRTRFAKGEANVVVC